jgi:TonB family protein
MNRISGSVLVLGLALGVMAIPCGRAQEKPGKAPPALPGQKGSNTNPAEQQEQGAVAVEIAKPIPPADRENLKGYWAGVQGKIQQRWQRAAAAKTAAAASDQVKIIGWIHTDGRVTGLAVERGSGNAAVDRAAMSAISSSAPYDPFPYGIAVDEVKVRFTFGSGGAAPGAAPPAVVH